MNSKESKSPLIILSIVNILFFTLVIFFIAVYATGHDIVINVAINNRNSVPVEKQVSTGKLPEDFNLTDEAWKIINTDFVDNTEIDSKKISQGAVRGMVDALDDRFSVYVDPDTSKLESSQFKGKYFGIGAYIGVNEDKQLIILAPMDNSPAKEAGLKSGDIILQIDGVDSVGMNVTEAALKIQGPAGTPVILQIYRETEEEPFDVEVTRREITIQSVYQEVKDNIGYIRLTGFQSNTNEALNKALEDVLSKDVEGIILDLRNNPGGLLDSAVAVTSQFIDKGIVTKVIDNKGNSSELPVFPGGKATDIPLVILINGGSASASEIVAGALQDYKRAVLIGETSYGKGSVQIIRKLSDGSSIHITIARWYTPDGHQIDNTGIKPDVVSELQDDELIDFAIEYLKKNVTR